jgi:Ser/Thr protein kinase RdoA (MazF antagonist)
LARLHASAANANTAALLPPWNYEADLQRSSQVAIDLLQRCRRQPDLAMLAAYLPPARRIANAFPNLHRQLLSGSALRSTIIHGDVHPGNVIVRKRAGIEEPILIDWGRARSGSPLEDVSAWLQSLGYWEPQARRRHDTLLTHYLSARQPESRISGDLRDAYWLAAACNAFSGALEYHLCILFAPSVPDRRKLTAMFSARDWLRIVRRAAAVWH